MAVAAALAVALDAQVPANAGDGVCQLGDIATECKEVSSDGDMASMCQSGCFQEMGDCESALVSSGMKQSTINTMTALGELCMSSVPGQPGAATCAQYFDQLSSPGTGGWLAPCSAAMSSASIATATCTQQCAVSVLPTMAACGDEFQLNFQTADPTDPTTAQAGYELAELTALCKLSVRGGFSSSTDVTTAGDGICQVDDIAHLCGSDLDDVSDSDPEAMETLCAAGCFQEISDCHTQLVAAANGDQTKINAIVSAIGMNDLCDSNHCARQMDGVSEKIQTSCGTSTGDEMPSTCSHKCASVFLPFMKSCGNTITAALGSAAAEQVGKFYNFEMLCETSALGGV